MMKPDWWPPNEGWNYDDMEFAYDQACKAMAKALLARIEAVAWRDSLGNLGISCKMFDALRAEVAGEGEG